MNESANKKTRKLWWDFRYIWMFISSAWVLYMIVGLIATWWNNSLQVNRAPWLPEGDWQEIQRPLTDQIAATILVAGFIAEYIHTLYRMYFNRSTWMTTSNARERWVTRGLLFTIPVILSSLRYEDEFRTWPMTFVFFVIAWVLTAEPHNAFSAVIISTGISVALVWFQYDEGVMLDVAVMCLAFGFFTSGYVINRGVILELQQERGRVRDQAVTEERFRLARDLHDTVGHSMTQITLKAELARRLLPDEPSRAADELEQIENLARSLSTEVRTSIAGETHLSLQDEINRARELLQSMEIAAEIRGDHEVIPETVADVFAWCLREGVMNVIKHSGASRCEIAFSLADHHHILNITDNGSNPVNEEHAGQGIVGMKQRVNNMNGELELRATDSGHALTIRIPV